jgi:hypothetical protein
MFLSLRDSRQQPSPISAIKNSNLTIFYGNNSMGEWLVLVWAFILTGGDWLLGFDSS